jgi:uncharacterized integral membrane protein
MAPGRDQPKEKGAHVWFLKVILFFVALALLVWFIVPNVQEQAHIRLIWPVDRPLEMPLALALLVAFFLGILTWAIVSIFRDIKTRTAVHRLRRENRRLQDEVERMRRAPIEDLGGALDQPVPPESPSPTEA